MPDDLDSLLPLKKKSEEGRLFSPDLAQRRWEDQWAGMPAFQMGDTDTVYAAGDKREAFVDSLVEQHPDVAKKVWRYERWHHEADYSSFRGNRLVLRDAFRVRDDAEYGMELIRLGQDRKSSGVLARQRNNSLPGWRP